MHLVDHMFSLYVAYLKYYPIPVLGLRAEFGSSLSAAWSTGAQQMIFGCFRFPLVLFDRPETSMSVMIHVVSSSSLLLQNIEV